MDGVWLRLAVALVLLAAFGSGSARVSATETEIALARSMVDDAELRAVAFVDALHGWAVGDRGVILATADGGQSWQPQNSGCDASLASVHFLDPLNGRAAGSLLRPYLPASRAVMLSTTDGGQNWEADKNVMLSGIKKIRFFTPRQGWVVAEPSAIFPSGLFCTDNGGQAWTPLPDQQVSRWTVADFADPHTAALAGDRGMQGVVRTRTLAVGQQSGLGLREPRAIRQTSRDEAWLVGDGGLLRVSHDGGETWDSLEQPPEAVEMFDLRAVEVDGTHVWAAGAPGSRVFHSADSGATWESLPTGQRLPLNALQFIDAQRGWAVGALGTILATADGGRSWQRQRGTRTRAALMALYSDPQRLPLEVFARLSANEGFITAVELLARRDAEPDTATLSSQAEHVRAALLAVGCSASEQAWGFPLRQPGLHPDVEQIVDGWNRIYGGRGVEQLEEHLVRQIRCWQPDVVLTSAASPSGEDPLGHLMNQAILRAVADAGDESKFPEQITAAGLNAWKVKKVVGHLPTGKLGTISVNTSQLGARLMRSLADYASPARGLLDTSYRASSGTLGFRLYSDAVPQGLGQQDFFSGIPLQPGGEARRELPNAGRSGMDAMRQVADKHRNLQAILAHSERLGRGGSVLLSQVAELSRGLDADTAGQALFELAQTYYGQGHWELAAATFQLLTERYPAHPLAPPSYVWLVQYWASGEAAARARPAATGLANSPAGARPIKVEALTPAGVLAASYDAPANSTNGRRDVGVEPIDPAARRARACQLAQALEKIDAHAWSDLHVQFPLALARPRNDPRDLDRFFATLAGTRPHDAWWACARGEQWLRDTGRDTPPKRTAHALRTAAKPRLDGKLTEDLWSQAARLELVSPLSDDAEWPATVLLAYDEEFLYIAIAARTAEQAQYTAEERTRQRDTDLGPYDRVELLLDVDRDWTTFYRLVIDYRGWANEDCWGDASWNPRWFVAATCDEQSWTCEAALPLAELSTEPVGQNTAWALGLQRIVPAAGFQSWTRPATVTTTTEGAGYLIFD